MGIKGKRFANVYRRHTNMRKEIEITICDKNYRIKQLSGTKGLTLLITLTKLGKGLIGGINKDNVLDSDLSLLAEGIFNHLDEEKIVKLLKDVLNESILVPKDFDFDMDIAGEYDGLLELFIEILKLNYEKSFHKLKKKAQDLIGKEKPLEVVK